MWLQVKHSRKYMCPGIGLIKRKLEKKRDAEAMAISEIAKHKINVKSIKVINTQFDYNEGYWDVLLEADGKKIKIILDSISGKVKN